MQNALEAESRAQRWLSDKGSIATGPLSVKMGVPGSTDCKSKGPEARESLVGGCRTVVSGSWKTVLGDLSFILEAVKTPEGF